MNLNRRGFLASLFALPAAVRATVAKAATLVPAPRFITYPWYQTTRSATYCSPAYLAAMEKIVQKNPLVFATIKPLTPDEFARMSVRETFYKK